MEFPLSFIVHASCDDYYLSGGETAETSNHYQLDSDLQMICRGRK